MTDEPKTEGLDDRLPIRLQKEVDAEENKVPDPPAQPELPRPKCPSCGADPLMPIGRQFNMGPVRILIVICRHCRNAVPAILLDVARPRIATPGDGSRIVRP